jgi:hypothetical protein
VNLFLVLALVVSGSVEYTPADPTVGDLVTITWPDPGEGRLSLLPSEEFELVEATGGKTVVRSFRPGAIRVVGEILTPGQQTQRHSVEIEIRSVLAENDDLRPAPLVLPKAPAPNRVARWAIAVAGVAALAAWILLVVVARRHAEQTGRGAAGSGDPVTAWLERLQQIARLPDEEQRWRELADATRLLLPRIDASLGPELTTTEVIETLGARRFDAGSLALVERILHGGDWAKFSPFGAPRDASSSVLSSARQLAGHVVRREAA